MPWQKGAMDSVSLKKPLLSIILCLLCVNAGLFASSLMWTWKSPNEQVSSFCYRLDSSDDWTVVDKDITSVVVPDFRFNTTYSIDIACTYDGEIWSDIVSRTFMLPKPKQYVIRFGLSAASFGLYDFYNGHDIENAKYLTVTQPGIGICADVGYLKNNNLEFNLGYKVFLLNKKETVLPDAFMVTNQIVKVGVNYHIPITESVAFKTGIDAGVMFSLNAQKYSIAPILGAGFGFDFTASDSFALSLSTGCSFAYNHSSDRLYRSMSYLLDGITFSIEKRL